MIPNMTSPTSSFGLRLAVTIIIGIGNICLLIAMCTNHWIKANGKDSVDHMGLWMICYTKMCVLHSYVLYTKFILAIAFFFGICCNILTILALVKGVKYLKRVIARAMFTEGISAMSGMIYATVILVRLPNFGHIEYGLGLGWLGTVLYCVAGFLSWYSSRIEPDIARTSDQMRQLILVNDALPPYEIHVPTTRAVS